MPSWTRVEPSRAAPCCLCRAASHRARGAVLSRTLEALGEWGVLLDIVFYVESSGYRTKRVGFVATFRLVSAEKSVLKVVGANLKDGQNVLVL